MRTGRVPLAALLLVLASSVLQVSSTNDIYWEGEEDASNEFLEVKQKDPTVLDHLKRLKRDWNPFSSFSFFDPPKEPEAEAETVTETVTDDNGSYGKDDDVDIGSGAPDKSDSEPREKTLRVTFLVMEPYITAYSNRDSPEFLNISRSLANAVDLLFESLPGTQRSSLVRIQSLVNDDFLCKVTLDIVTTRNEDTDTIKDILRNHIKNIGRLGETSVREGDFSAQLIDPGTSFDCDSFEFECDGNCLPLSARCNGLKECRDSTDEYDCPPPPTSEATPMETTTVYDYENNDYKEDDIVVDNPTDRNPFEATSEYPNTDKVTPETPNIYDPARPDKSYDPTAELVPYDQRPDNGYSYNTNTGPDSRDPYRQNAGPDNRDPYRQNAGPDNRDPYGQNVGSDNRNPYGQNVGSDNRNPYGQNVGSDNRNPYGQNVGSDNRNPYGQNVGSDNRNPYGQNVGSDNRNPYGQNVGSDNRDPYGQNVGSDNRDPYGQNVGSDNRDPYGQNVGSDNRDPYGQNVGSDNRNPYGTTARPDNRSPYDQNGNPNSGLFNPDNRTPVVSTTETPSSGYGQESGYFPRGDLGGAGDSTDIPDTETETATYAATPAYGVTGGSSYDCPATYLRCDETRCVEAIHRCDGIHDCFDGTDEAGCPSRKYMIM